MSFKNIINNNGPKTDPCGTPTFENSVFDSVLSILTHVVLSLRKFLMVFRAESLNLYFFNLAQKIS
jgi:hypothetical protein